MTYRLSTRYTKRSADRGFTIIELLIVILVIGILAGLVLNTFSRAQAQSRDGKRSDDITAIAKGLEMYYLDKGQYPPSGGSTSINASWSTTADASWQNFINALKPYTGEVPSDPISTSNANVTTTGLNYGYFSNPTGTYCGTGNNQMYILVYRLEVLSPVNQLIGDCTTTPVGPYGGGVSNYRHT